MSKARDLANAGTALTTVSATELGYLDGVTSAVQTQIDSKEPTLPSQTGNSGKYLTTNGTAKSWGTVSQYALPSQTGNAGKFLTTNGTAESWGTVNQPITFTGRKAANINQTAMTGFAYNGSNLWVAVSNGGYLFSSTDGITWTARTSNFGTSNIRGVAFGNGLFVAYGASGKITTSTDGITWTARTANMGTNQIEHAIYANSLWVAVGDGVGSGTGGVTTSTDGITWTKRTVPSTGGDLIYVTYANGYYVAGGNYNSFNLMYSTNGTSWTGAHDGSNTQVHFIYYNGTQWITATNDSNRFTASTPPASGWGNLAGNHILASKRMTQEYNSKIYTRTDLSDTTTDYLTYISVINPTISNESVNSLEMPIFLPSGRGGGFLSAFNVSNAGIVYGDDYGRIYTSF